VSMQLYPHATATVDPRNVAFCEKTCITQFNERCGPACLSASASGARCSDAASYSGVVILVVEWFAKLHYRWARGKALHEGVGYTGSGV